MPALESSLKINPCKGKGGKEGGLGQGEVECNYKKKKKSAAPIERSKAGVAPQSCLTWSKRPGHNTPALTNYYQIQSDPRKEE